MKLSRPRQWKLTIFPKLVIAFLLVIAPLYVIGLIIAGCRCKTT